MASAACSERLAIRAMRKVGGKNKGSDSTFVMALSTAFLALA
jgi:hypothetical protein